MSKRILIVGAGPNQVGVITKAKAMGFHAIAMDGDPEAPGLAYGDVAIEGNITDADEIIRVAQEHQADGIYPAAEACVVAAAQAAQAIGLPGVSPETATFMRDKLAMRQALDGAGVANVAYRAVTTAEDANAAALALGLPVIVKPADGNASKGVRQVEHIEDMVLAFTQAQGFAPSGTVLIEEFVEGDEYNVDGMVFEGRYRLGGITGKERSPLPFRFDLGIFMPPLLDDETAQAVEDTVAQALSAVGYHTGTSHVEIILSPRGPRIVEMAGRPGGGRIPTDLVPMTYGMDFMADALRIVLGEAPCESHQFERGTAVYWVPTPAGVVISIEGADEARAIVGVEDVVITAQPGDVMGHVVDCVTRDRVGYVYAAADTVEEAMAIAYRARACCAIITSPTRP
jgi:biotin carboxylase